jgi:hypothetical protein
MPRANRHPARIHLAHHASLPPKELSAEICARSTVLSPLNFEAKKRFGLSVLDYTVTCTTSPFDQGHRLKRYRRGMISLRRREFLVNDASGIF